MTLRVCDLQSDSDLDSIRNSCDVFNGSVVSVSKCHSFLCLGMSRFQENSINLLCAPQMVFASYIYIWDKVFAIAPYMYLYLGQSLKCGWVVPTLTFSSSLCRPCQGCHFYPPAKTPTLPLSSRPLFSSQLLVLGTF